MVETDKDSEMLSEVYAILDQLANNSKEEISIEDKSVEKIENIITQRTGELSLAVQIAQALMVKHENNLEKIRELTESNNTLKEQQNEYKLLLNQTMESLERNSKKVNILTEEKDILNKKITSLQLKFEVSEQKNTELLEEKKELDKKLNTTESKLVKSESENKKLTEELDLTVEQLKNTKSSEVSINNNYQMLKNKYDSLETTYNEYYNSTQEELYEIYEKSEKPNHKEKNKFDGVETIILEENSDVSKTRSENGGSSITENNGPKINTLMQIIEQVSQENAKLKVDYVELQELLAESRNEIATLQEAELNGQLSNQMTNLSMSQEIETVNQKDMEKKYKENFRSIEIQTDEIKKPKSSDKGTQCNIINVIHKKKKTTPPSTPSSSSGRSSSASTHNLSSNISNRSKSPYGAYTKKIINNKVITSETSYYLSPADTRFNSSYAVEGRPPWKIWKLKSLN